MSLQVGQLHATLGLDDSQFQQGMQNNHKMFAGMTAGLVSIAAGAAASIGAALVGTVVAGDSLQKAMNGLQAQTGATAGEMGELEGMLKTIYSNNYGESFADIADTLALAKQQTSATGEELQYLAQDALMLRDTFGYDVAESIKASDRMMDQFGVTGGQAMALIAEATQKGLNQGDDLIDTIDEYSVYFQQAGFSAEEMFGIMENASKAGVRNLDVVGDAMKEFGIIMKEDGEKASDALTALGLPAEKLRSDFAQGGEAGKAAFSTIMQSLGEVEDPLKRNQLGVELFGTKFEDLEADAILAMSNINGTITGSIETLDKINEIKYDSFGEAMQGIGRQLVVGLVLPLSEQLLPILNQFANWLQEKIPAIIEFGQTVGTAIGGAIQKVVEFFGSFEGKADIVAGVVDTVKGLFAGWKEYFTGIFSGEGNVGESLMKMFQTAKEIAMPILQDVVVFVKAQLDKMKQFWNENGEQIIQAVKNMWQIISAVFEAIAPVLTFIVEGLWNGIKNIISGATKVIMGIIQVFAGLLTGDFSKMWEGVKNIFTGALQVIWGLLEVGFLGRAIKIIKGFGLKAIDFIADMVIKIKGKFDDLVAAGASKFNSLKDKIITPITNAKNQAINFMEEMVSRLLSKWDSLRSQAASKFEEIKQAIITPIKNLVSDMYNIGSDVVSGLINGLSSKVGAIMDKARSIASSIKDTITGALDINSPSRVMMQLGSYVGEGLALGLDKSVSGVIQKAGKLAVAAVPNFNSAYSPSLAGAGVSNISNRTNNTIHVNVRADDLDQASKFVRMIDNIQQEYRRR